MDNIKIQTSKILEFLKDFINIIGFPKIFWDIVLNVWRYLLHFNDQYFSAPKF